MSRMSGVAAMALFVFLSACGAGVEAGDEGELGELEDGLTRKASTTIAGKRVEASFAAPLNKKKQDATIVNEVIRLIDKTPKGARINAAVHSLSLMNVYNALSRAKKRGVSIQIVEDGSDEFDSSDVPRKLHKLFGKNHVFCGDRKKDKNYGCITTAEHGIMHSKFFTFSRTRSTDKKLRNNVVWFGSNNFTSHSGTGMFNNAVTIYDDRALFDGFNGYFKQLYEQQHFGKNDFYDAGKGRGYWSTPTARVYASPDEDGDLIVARLNDIRPDSSCRVRVAVAAMRDSRQGPVKELAKLASKGCRVWVVTEMIQPDSLKVLQREGISVRTQIIHDKSVAVDAKFGDSKGNRKIVFTGSPNWTYAANYQNDEIFVFLESAALHGAFVNHFNDAYNKGDAPKCKNDECR